ncbi:hypothetical protein BHE74_00055999 [Ensete ventricosum]|nr:hypothetical protein BHE74_00055999 [Ensete ventricosum]
MVSMPFLFCLYQHYGFWYLYTGLLRFEIINVFCYVKCVSVVEGRKLIMISKE